MSDVRSVSHEALVAEVVALKARLRRTQGTILLFGVCLGACTATAVTQGARDADVFRAQGYYIENEEGDIVGAFGSSACGAWPYPNGAGLGLFQGSGGSALIMLGYGKDGADPGGGCDLATLHMEAGSSDGESVADLAVGLEGGWLRLTRDDDEEVSIRVEEGATSLSLRDGASLAETAVHAGSTDDSVGWTLTREE